MPPWTCDTCGETIATAEDGWVEWITYRDENGRRARDFRLVHHRPASPRRNGCQFDEREEFARDKGTVSDLPLRNFLGMDGLNYLLCLIHEGEIPLVQLVEMIKRLHITGYEEARFFIKSAMHEGVYEPNKPEGFPTQAEIREILRFGSNQRE